ncbi:MAG: hypothetical protein RL701_4963, partial [Pseudomonadota bacterium]
RALRTDSVRNDRVMKCADRACSQQCAPIATVSSRTPRSFGAVKSNYVGDYRLIAKLGRGAATDVLLAVREIPGAVGEFCVLKRLREELWTMSVGEQPQPLWPAPESQRATRLVHDNIVQTQTAALDGPLPYRALTYVDGQPLDRVLAVSGRAGGLALMWTLYIVDSVLSALTYAHRFEDSPFLHRDVHAHNVFLSYSGEVKLADFGAEKHALRRDDGERQPVYTAPEQALGQALDARIDVFGAGVLLWECLAIHAERPVHTPSTPTILPPLAAVRPDLDPELAAVCDRALEPDPERRYPSAQAMQNDLRRVLGETSKYRAELASFVQRAFEEERLTRARQVEHFARRTTPAPAPRPTMRSLPPSRLSAAPPLPTGHFMPPSAANFELPEAAVASKRASVRERSESIGPAVLLRTSTEAKPPSGRYSGRGALLLALGAACVALLAGVLITRGSNQPAAAPPTAAELAETVAPEIVLRLCGSNTVGDELVPSLVEAFLHTVGGEAPARRRQGNDSDANAAKIISAQIDHKPLGVEIRARGSATAFTGLAEGACDIGMASRAIDDAESAALRERGHGDMHATGSEHVLALDGIAVVVHPNNPVQKLDRDALHDIYTGKISDWSALGGTAGPIHVLARDDKSGTFDTFKHLVLGKDALASSAQRYEQSAALADAVTSDPAAIGFVGFAAVRGAKALAVGEKGAVPMLPTRFTVATEGYMLSRRLYLYTLPKPRTPWVADFVSFALSRRGQEVVAKSQFIDLSVSANAVACDARCSARYSATVAKAQRVSVDFRFRSGSDELDTRANRDIDRFVSFLAEQTSNPKVLLLGFSDALGQTSANEKLSLQRAHAIERALTTRGIQPSVVKGFGAEMPVASNNGAVGRQRNRRVEVWIEP